MAKLDVLGKDFSCLESKKLYLFDMDGTIYLDNDLFEGVDEFLNRIKDDGGKYVFITNNSSKSVVDYVKKLHNLGLKYITEQDFFTSAQAAIRLFKEQFGKKLIYAQGTRSFINGLKESGLNVTEEFDLSASAVLVGFDPELTGEKLKNTCNFSACPVK